MAVDDSSQTPVKLEGKFGAIIICWILGIGSLISWNSLTSIEDYYYDVFPDYHPSRVLTLVYQPFAFGTMAFLAYNESKIDTRKRNVVGYIMFFLATFALILLDLATFGKGSIESYMGICLFVATFGVADALVQGGMIGDLALMCPEFIQSFLAGMAASGALTSALRLLTEAAFNNYENGLRKGALLFLSISTLFGYKGPEKNALGNLLVLFLLGGIFLGAALDWLWLIGNGSFLDQSAKEFIDFVMSSEAP
ncbi:hypothetical protein L2E82_15174 [Cichorium intybus]|uniref:Uncharacterized protein n=1 Tax=Cichorium intybus TaxID=13427 RepID=A0ACB9F2M6_CICIN|nr:hypothetical protein L2E82_15174 [Cichorium intybus]